MWTVILAVLALVLGVIAVFLAKEIIARWAMMEKFSQGSNQVVEYDYEGGYRPAMRNIVLRSQSGKRFSAIVGARIVIPVFGSVFCDYGFVQSDEKGVAVVSTWFGYGECRFQFIVNQDLDANDIIASSGHDDQLLTATAVYPPHFWQ